ncbi:ABC transporter ATP-binding protein [Prauserella cavernicola]|uniref:ABC-type quaternary amine transporter n=1 Tax=Prauserella cavernicola TaxID=2800127 RepID=A0A934QNH1_9PSEU|nr:ABC transporter ATP-binding protein [Prauserella cavernicola]MBK1783876.1 ABC transporter ATP-binding protein [Prauserella cavernicola]
MTANTLSAEGAQTSASAEAAGLELHELRKSYGDVHAVDGVSLSLEPGQLLALLGPSGCGKTTTLRMIAGLEQPTGGEIRVGHETLASSTHSVEPEHRELGMVFQSYALWPHMTSFENVAYGLRRKKVARAEITRRVEEALEIVGMSAYGTRSITQLSGGQQQRVAVARALVTRPRLLLFDEPLSNLDAVLRESMRFEIRSLQQANGITAVYVTHSQEEALTIADVVGVMKDGVLQQLAPPQELYARPRTRFVAGFVGLANFFDATVLGAEGDRVRMRLADGTELAVPGPDPLDRPAGAEATIALRPEHFDISTDVDRSTTGRVALRGEVVSSMFSGNIIDYFVRIPGHPDEIRVQDFPPQRANPGENVVLSAATEHCILLTD